MNLQHIAFKVFVEGELATDWEQFINVFHSWVADQSMPEMMIDVADYRHVPNGPGVVMVGNEADYYMDNTGGKPGLRYVCKVEKTVPVGEQIQQAFACASAACARLESELSDLKFSRTEFEVTINDRAFAPNTPETRASIEQDFPAMLAQALGSSVTIQVQQAPRKLSGCLVTTSAPVALAAA